MILANIAVGFTLSLCVLIIAYGRDRPLFVWALIFALHATGYALIALRGLIPDFISIVIANTFISAMLALYIEAINRLENQQPRRLLIWPPVLITFGVYWAYSNDVDQRIFVGSFLYAFQTFILILAVRRGFREREGRGKWIIAGAVGLITLMLVLRGTLALLSDQPMTDVSSVSFVPMLTSLGAIVSLIMFAFGLVVVFKERAEEETRELALRDPLTSLGNRRMLETALRQALRGSMRSNQIGAIVLMDLDDFKPLNDHYGHSLGDQLLVEVGYRLKECVKADDTVVRLGGDEFVVLLSNLGTDVSSARVNARAVATRILREIAKPYHCLGFAVEDQKHETILHKCTCSIGLAFFVGNLVSQVKLLANADAAMYRAKEQGRNRIVIHEGPEMS